MEFNNYIDTKTPNNPMCEYQRYVHRKAFYRFIHLTADLYLHLKDLLNFTAFAKACVNE